MRTYEVARPFTWLRQNYYRRFLGRTINFWVVPDTNGRAERKKKKKQDEAATAMAATTIANIFYEL